MLKKDFFPQLRITFDDGATTTFEYPSESSLLEDVVPSAGLTSPMGKNAIFVQHLP